MNIKQRKIRGNFATPSSKNQRRESVSITVRKLQNKYSQTYSCHSGWNASAVQGTGGSIWTTQTGWKPEANLDGKFLTSRAPCPRQEKFSRSETMLIAAIWTSCSRSSRSYWNITICPAAPATISVSDNTQRWILRTARRGSSLKGSYVPTWLKRENGPH